MTPYERIARDTWIGYWRLLQRYHRYSVEGLEQLNTRRAMLVAGYHGRPLAYDMCMLTVAIRDRYGYLPHGIVHDGINAFPQLKSYADALGFVTEDGAEIEAALRKGQHIVVTPGGAREGCRSFRERYQVAWQGRLGYVRLAAKYGLPIVPVAAVGADDTYIGINNAEAIGRWLGVPKRWAFVLWLGIGPVGLYPFSPPFPVRLRQFIGKPIDPWQGRRNQRVSHATLERVHARVVAAVQHLLDDNRNQTKQSDDDDG